MPKIEKEFEYKGYKCCVIFQNLCHRCGYVAIPKESRFCDVDYNEIDCEIMVHGGITYGSRYMFEHGDEDYWIGWDYAHYNDGKDYKAGLEYFNGDEGTLTSIAFMKHSDEMFNCYEGHIYTLEEVVEECKNVVDQLIEIE